MQVGGIVCDRENACDCVNRDILLAKLHFYGIRGLPADWFRARLTTGRQKSGRKNH